MKALKRHLVPPFRTSINQFRVHFFTYFSKYLLSTLEQHNDLNFITPTGHKFHFFPRTLNINFEDVVIGRALTDAGKRDHAVLDGYEGAGFEGVGGEGGDVETCLVLVPCCHAE